MIRTLRLYRPSKQVAWLLDELKEVLDRIKGRLSRETDLQRAEKLKDASIHLEAALYRMQRIFVHSYMNEKGKRS